MGKPRIFVSSTYYDLKSIRADLERFIKDRGYDPVLNERGHITYSKEMSPEVACYREIASCDILVSIIGGKIGSQSYQADYSISQLELKTALEQYKQVYIFVERDVLSEYRTYLKNKRIELEWASVDNVKVYKFMEEIYSLPNNNAIMPFDTAHDIVNMLREQWAGLFQRMLQDATNSGAYQVAQELRQGVETARQLVELLQTDQGKRKDESVHMALMPNHPAFARIKKILRVPYRVYFTNKDELNSWLKVRYFKDIDKDAWDNESEMEWFHEKDVANWDLLKISLLLFDESDRFRPDQVEWQDSLIRREARPREISTTDDDDVPF